MRHDEAECFVETQGMEVLRRLLQAYHDVRGQGFTVGPVVGADGVARTQRRTRGRALETVLGGVQVRREVVSAPGVTSLMPHDAALNLPPEKYSLEVQRRTAWQAARVSFDEAVEGVALGTAAHVPKRQVEQLTVRAAEDFEGFYKQKQAAAAAAPPTETGPILALSSDGKGIAMRRKDLREATRKARDAKSPRLQRRLAKGEKRQQKRMATVGAVYTAQPFVRTPDDVVGDLKPVHDVEKARPRRPRPEHKRVFASVEHDAEDVVDEVFQEAASRDPQRTKRWVGLVDGNETQLAAFAFCAKHYGVALTIIIDVIHVIEYLWKAGCAFLGEGESATEAWVQERLLEILRGNSSQVAAGMRRSATSRGLTGQRRKAVDKCADYLLKYRKYLHYDEYLAAGLPIATGVIEGACRHLVNDRLGITGARWSLAGAEAVLRLRALRSSGDFDEYWAFHRQAELQRNHLDSYANAKPPAVTQPSRLGHLRLCAEVSA